MSGSFKAKLTALRGVRHIEIYALLFLVALAFLLLNQGNPAANTDAASGVEIEGTTALEQRIERVLSQVQGAGRVRVLVREKGESIAAFGTIDRGAESSEGVVVVAEGAKSVRVQLELQRAVKALLGIDLDRIEVLAMEGSG